MPIWLAGGAGVGAMVYARTQPAESNPTVAGVGMLTSAGERDQACLPQMDRQGVKRRLDPHSERKRLYHLEVAEEFLGAVDCAGSGKLARCPVTTSCASGRRSGAMIVIVKVWSTNPDYSAGCDYAVVEISEDFAKVMLRRIGVLSEQKVLDPAVCETYYWDSSPQYFSPWIDREIGRAHV